MGNNCCCRDEEKVLSSLSEISLDFNLLKQNYNEMSKSVIQDQLDYTDAYFTQSKITRNETIV